MSVNAKIVTNKERAARRKHSASFRHYWERLTAEERAAMRAGEERMHAALPFLRDVRFTVDEFGGRGLTFGYDRECTMSQNLIHVELARARVGFQREWMDVHPIGDDRVPNVEENEREARQAAAWSAAAQEREREMMEWAKPPFETPEEWQAEYDRIAGRLTIANVVGLVDEEHRWFSRALCAAIQRRDGCTLRVARNRSDKLLYGDDIRAATDGDRAAARRLTEALWGYRSDAALAVEPVPPVAAAVVAAEDRRERRRRKQLELMSRRFVS